MTHKSDNSLQDFKLHFEELEKKKVPKTAKPVASTQVSAIKRKPEPTFKERVTTKVTSVKSRLNGAISHRKPKSKLTKKAQLEQRNAVRDARKRAIIGIGLLLTVVSIAFSTFVTITFVDGFAVYIALAPQVAFAVISLVKAFSKLYK